MQKIDERSLELKPEQYFDYCKNNKNIRGVWVITDKQSIFYSQVLKDDYRTHDDIYIDIENEIHPNEQKFGWDAIRQSHAYIASAGKELMIQMPDNGKLSYTQAKFIIDTLNIVDKYNSNENNKKIKIDLFEPEEKESIFGKTTKEDIERLRNKIQSEITPNIQIEEEKIIGNTLPKNEVIDNIICNLNINSCKSVEDLLILLSKCSSYLEDEYYKEIFKEIMPNYKSIEVLNQILIASEVQNEQLENITLENLENKIYKLIKDNFKKNKTYESIFVFIHKLESLDKTLINKLFPNYELLLTICKDITSVDRKELDEQLKEASSYEDVVKIITKYMQIKNKKELLENHEKLNKYNNELEEIKQAKKIIDSKEYLNGLIDNRKKSLEIKNEYTLTIEENKKEIANEEVSQENINRLIKKSSSNFFKRIIFRNRIKKYEHKLEESKIKIGTLSTDNKEKEDRINNLNKEIDSIEIEFKNFTKFDYIPDNISDMDYYYQKDLNKYEESTIYFIDYLKKDIDMINNNLEEIEKSNILKDNHQKIAELQKSMQEDAEDIVTSESFVIQDSPKSITNSK